VERCAPGLTYPSCRFAGGHCTNLPRDYLEVRCNDRVPSYMPPTQRISVPRQPHQDPSRTQLPSAARRVPGLTSLSCGVPVECGTNFPKDHIIEARCNGHESLCRRQGEQTSFPMHWK